jgi:hypothetical protein
VRTCAVITAMVASLGVAAAGGQSNRASEGVRRQNGVDVCRGLNAEVEVSHRQRDATGLA